MAEDNEQNEQNNPSGEPSDDLVDAAMLIDFDAEDLETSTLLLTRDAFIRQAATAAIAPRYVSASYYGQASANTADGCLILPFCKEWALGEDSGTVRVSFDPEAPREEVAAVLRHLATALETNTCPPLKRTASLVDTLTADIEKGDYRHG